jgi:hypothetical protein
MTAVAAGLPVLKADGQIVPLTTLPALKSAMRSFCPLSATGTPAMARCSPVATTATTGALLLTVLTVTTWASPAVTRTRTAAIGLTASVCVAFQNKSDRQNKQKASSSGGFLLLIVKKSAKNFSVNHPFYIAFVFYKKCVHLRGLKLMLDLYDGVIYFSF